MSDSPESEPPSVEGASIYLAGPVAHVDDGGAGWREDVVDEYGDEFEFQNPLAQYNVPADQLSVVDGTSDPENLKTVSVNEIVGHDKKLLEDSDAVLVGYDPVPPIGTPMEVMWAFERDYPIALWPRDGSWLSDVSPWYRHHVGHFGSLPSCLEHLTREVADD
jgi:nucleoside 2-deoxyribosyltransferase